MCACRLVGRGAVQFPLDGKPCLTEYEALGHTRSARHNWVTTVRLRPHTGVWRTRAMTDQHLLSFPGTVQWCPCAPGWGFLRALQSYAHSECVPCGLRQLVERRTAHIARSAAAYFQHATERSILSCELDTR